MKTLLTKHEAGRDIIGGVVGTGSVYRYRVGRLPPGEEAFLADIDHAWRILRTRHGIQGKWTGSYASADDALADLQREFA